MLSLKLTYHKLGYPYLSFGRSLSCNNLKKEGVLFVHTFLFFNRLQMVLLPTSTTFLLSISEAAVELQFSENLMISSSNLCVFLALLGRNSKRSPLFY